VQDCLAHTGQRPIEWLLNHLPLNAHWNLVNATHTTPAELQGVRDSGAAIVICPSTEANLGDGVFDYPGFARIGGCQFAAASAMASVGAGLCGGNENAVVLIARRSCPSTTLTSALSAPPGAAASVARLGRRAASSCAAAK
jgi:hypothetical protein